MNFRTAIQIASSGMSAQRLRLNLLSSNLANANSTRSDEGGPYRRRDAVFTSASTTDPFETVLSEMEEEYMRGVTVDRVARSDDFREVFDPSHPDANKDGYVSMPSVNVVEEMVDLLQATRTYDANAQAIKALKAMAQQALNIG